MKKRERVRVAATLLALQVAVALLLVGPLQAQDWSWPERAENLTELPADLPPERLGAVIRGFSQALGVRCSHCHVGEEGQPLSTYDFLSDCVPAASRMVTVALPPAPASEAWVTFTSVPVFCHV